MSLLYAALLWATMHATVPELPDMSKVQYIKVEQVKIKREAE